MSDPGPERTRPDSPEFEPIIILSTAESAQLRAPDPPPVPVRTPARPRPQAGATASRPVLDVLLVAAAAAALFVGGAWLMPFWSAADARLPDPTIMRIKRSPPPASPGPDAAPAVEPPWPQGEAPPPPRRPEPPKPAAEPAALPAGPPGTFRARVTVQGPKLRHEATLQVRAAWSGDRYRLAADGGDPDLDCVRLLLAFGPAAGAARRDEEIRAGGGALRSRFCESGAERAWELLHPSRAVVRRDAPDWSRKVTKIGRETLEIGARRIECLSVEGEDEFPAGRRRFRLWFSPEFPFGALRAELVSAELTLRGDVLEFAVER